MQHESIDAIVAELRHRKWTLNAMNLGLRGLFYGGLLAVAGVLVSLVVTNPAAMQLGCWLLAMPMGSAIGLLVGLIFPIDSFRLARALDQAAGSDDRFASAMQLAGHHREQRVGLITTDALSAVRGADARQALPMKVPTELRWLPLVLCLLVVSLFVRPGGSATAEIIAPEVTANRWQELQAEFRRQIDRDLKDADLPEEDSVAKQLRRLASSLSKHPDKKAVLSEVARLRSELSQQREQLRTRDINMRRATQALSSSEALQALAALLKQGKYSQASDELKRLAAELREGKLSLSAEQFESIAADFQRLAEQLQPHDDFNQACQECSSAASSFDQQRLADSLDKLCERLTENADDLKKNDTYCRACDSLDQFERRLAQSNANKKCSVCQGKNSNNCTACQGGQGKSQQFVQGRGQKKVGVKKGGSKKRGLRAGKGTAGNWLSGKLGEQEIGRIPDVVPDRQQGGPQTVVAQSISKDEDADSTLQFKENFAKFVQQAEADLELEDIPLAYRDFLRRYFAAIKPEEARASDD